MADPKTTPAAGTDHPAAGCCAPEAQVDCCEPVEKADCCGTEHAAGTSCGCAAGSSTAAPDDVREVVRERYAAAALAANGVETAGCCGPGVSGVVATADAQGREVFGGSLYADSDVPEAAVAASLGCGVPTAVADLQEGETVLDLGSGAGADVLISARRVGVTGKAIGLDMTDEMLDLARRNAADASVTNVEFVKGYIEDIPLAERSVDVVISNCVLNLSGDKPHGSVGDVTPLSFQMHAGAPLRPLAVTTSWQPVTKDRGAARDSGPSRTASRGGHGEPRTGRSIRRGA